MSEEPDTTNPPAEEDALLQEAAGTPDSPADLAPQEISMFDKIGLIVMLCTVVGAIVFWWPYGASLSEKARKVAFAQIDHYGYKGKYTEDSDRIPGDISFNHEGDHLVVSVESEAAQSVHIRAVGDTTEAVYTLQKENVDCLGRAMEQEDCDAVKAYAKSNTYP